MTIPADARRQVIRRVEDRCEYCGLSQVGQEALFHVDHVVPVTAGGTAALDNLALACVSCSLRKGARQQAPDPKIGKEVPLFHPRQEVWGTSFSVGWRSHSWPHADGPCHGGCTEHEPPSGPRDSAGRDHPWPPSPVAVALGWIPPTLHRSVTRAAPEPRSILLIANRMALR